LLLFNLLDGSDPVIWIYDLLADSKAHHSTSIEFAKIRLRRTRGSGGTPLFERRSLRRIPLDCEASLASGLRERQADRNTQLLGEKKNKVQA